MNAILIIFGNILLEPLEPQAEHDMKLLKSTADLIKRIRSQGQITVENLDITRMDAFISEVIRLGNCAIAAARRERDVINTI
jgi:flagellar motor component MotA